MPSNTPKLTAAAVKQALAAVSSPERAHTSAWFFKTGPGEYGEGDTFIGVRVPQQRAVAKQFSALPLEHIEMLLDSAVHEHRLTALHILNLQFEEARKAGDSAMVRAVYNLYIRKRDRVNNWDLVDSSAHKIVGPYLCSRSRKPLYTLARARSLWDRRIAIIATMHFLTHDDFADTIALSKLLLHDSEDLMHKAVGWTLREMGKRDIVPLRTFLDEHAHEMPRTMLRYAIEKLSVRERKHYMSLGK